ncbi:hypothetical protein M426DRAFT_26326 [Hypoxylon sp. CI-4A]|nr:hypothetical protein M426DRAFT_26326 [Hypoxylon sp. CI-4A]
MRWVLKFAAGALLSTSTVAGPVLDSTNKRYVEKRDGVNYHVFEHASTKSKLSFVKNSGICETTPGVNQYSGYLTVNESMNMWFWVFEARENPQTAPLVAYVDGGPGTASEYGLFTQIGPCHFVKNETTPSLNPFAFNNYANMLFIDQPSGVGFSYGNTTVNSTEAAAPVVWSLIQAFYDGFPEYENRDFGLFSESYGGHYAPEFARYIIAQNDAIARGDIQGKQINMRAVGIHNGWFDATIQERSNIEYAYNNSYGQFLNESFHDDLVELYDVKIKPALDNCTSNGTTDACYTAWQSYTTEIEQPIITAMREKSPDLYLGDIRDPFSRAPATHVTYLQRPEIQKALGARVNYTDQGGASGFYYSGDGRGCPIVKLHASYANYNLDARPFLGSLSDVVQAGVRVLIWSGDADYVSNWAGTLEVADTVDWHGREAFSSQKLEPYTLNGVEKGTFKSLDNLIFMRIYEAGHNLPFYQPEVSLQIFKQTMGMGNIVPT